MKKLLCFFIVVFFALNCEAQMFRSLINKLKTVQTNTEQTTNESKQKIVYNKPFPPLGIEKPDAPLVGNPGSAAYSWGIQSVVRTKGWGSDPFHPDNEDATRFLEKAVRENNVENAEKFLMAGASAFISYEMIDKKQYEMIDLMYKDNPKLIRYSQLLHYACANSDSTMIDFLVDRNASFDLNGYYVAYGSYLYGEKGYEVKCRWNSDANYPYTPADVALFRSNWNNLDYIGRKYQKYPSIYGCCQFLNRLIDAGFYPPITNFISNFPFQDKVDYTITDVLNFGYHYLVKHGNTHRYKSKYLLISTVQKIADCRKAKLDKDKNYVDLLNLMINNGADVNIEAGEKFAREIYADPNSSPMVVALKNSNMLDIVELLSDKGATFTITINGQKASILKNFNVLDEYKEYLMLKGIY